MIVKEAVITAQIDIQKKLRGAALIPVVSVKSSEQALKYAEMYLASGVPVLEITLRTDAAIEGINAVANTFPDIIIGAGTVITVDAAAAAVDAGAQFIVSPGFDQDVVDYCIHKGIPVIPGCSGATDVQMAVKAGLKLVKLFPAGALGGPAYIKALAAPFDGVEFFPTGGVNGSTIEEFLSFDRTCACGGSYIAVQSLANNDAWDQARALVRQRYLQAFGLIPAECGYLTLIEDHGCQNDAIGFYARTLDRIRSYAVEFAELVVDTDSEIRFILAGRLITVARFEYL